MIAAATLGLALLAATTARTQSLSVNGVRFWSLGDITRVAIEIDGPFHFRTDRAESPPRIFFDIANARPAMVRKGIYTISVGDRLIRQIRVAENQPGVTRIVLDLEGPFDYSTSELVNPTRLMVEVRGQRAQEAHLPVSPGGRASNPPPREPINAPEKVFVPPKPHAPDQAPAPIVPPKIDVPPGRVLAGVRQPIATPRMPGPPAGPASDPPSAKPVAAGSLAAPAPLTSATAPPIPKDAVPMPAKRTAAGDRSMTRVLGLKIQRVVLDPGHGGHDHGTTGPKGLDEKDLVLDIAKRLGALIESKMGAEVIYTRTDDTFVPLESRTELANEVHADLFLSIHANSSPLPSASGVETYYLNFATSKADLEVAARENASSQKSVYELKELLNKIALKDKADESREFAARVQASLFSFYARNNPKLRNRGVKRAPFVVLIGASMPSVLAEIGFVSNAREEALLNKADHRQKIAEALYKGITQYAGTLSHFQVAQRHE